jgi:hypothetical protein
MKKSILTAFFALIISISFAQEKDTYKSSLKRLLQVSGSEVAYKGVLIQMTSLFKQQQPTVPAEFWDEFLAEANKDSFNQLINLILPIYRKHLAETDLVELITFYETPVGKKFAEKTPLITQESMLAGQEWGKQIGQHVLDKLKAKGYVKQ